MLASRRRRKDAVRALLAHGARQELQNRRGWTAMHFAASNGDAGMLELLCAAPGAAAAIALRSKRGRSALDLLRAWRNALFDDEDAASPTDEFREVRWKREDVCDSCMQVLLAHGAT